MDEKTVVDDDTVRIGTDPIKARRASKLAYAKRRVQHIVEAMPPLTAAQRRELAAILVPEDQDRMPAA